MTRNPLLHTVALAAFIALPGWAPADATAAAPSAARSAAQEERAARTPRAPRAPKAAKAAKQGGVRIQPSQNHSGESRAERDRRLLRECRGLPNAGACRGYAQP